VEGKVCVIGRVCGSGSKVDLGFQGSDEIKENNEKSKEGKESGLPDQGR